MKWHIKRISNSNDVSKERLELIEYLSKISPAFPRIEFEYTHSEIIQYSEYIKQAPWPGDHQSLSALWGDFETEVAKAHTLNYVHGDILKKNILFDGNRLKLIDHEFCLERNNILRATFPWIHETDLIESRLSRRTDDLCLRVTKSRLFDYSSYKKLRKEQTERIELLRKIRKVT